MQVIEYRLPRIAIRADLSTVRQSCSTRRRPPATELAALYERWEIETALAKRTRTCARARSSSAARPPTWSARSSAPDDVAARRSRIDARGCPRSHTDPDELSFLHAVRVIQRKLAAFNATWLRRPS